jgi:hypothetical protein
MPESDLEALTDRSRRPWLYGNQLPAQVQTAILNLKRVETARWTHGARWLGSEARHAKVQIRGQLRVQKLKRSSRPE